MPTMRLPSRAVSETHAVIHIDAGSLSIIDERSTNGTQVNGQSLVQGRHRALRPGDRITLAHFEILIESSADAPDPPGRTGSVARKLLFETLARQGGEVVAARTCATRGSQQGTTMAPAHRVSASGRRPRGDLRDRTRRPRLLAAARSVRAQTRRGVWVRDLGSKNGISVGGRTTTERRLRDGDEVPQLRALRAVVSRSRGRVAARAFESGPDEVAPKSEVRAAPAAPAPVPQVETPRPVPVVERARNKTGDWIVIALAVVILGVSIAALFVLLHGTPR